MQTPFKLTARFFAIPLAFSMLSHCIDFEVDYPCKIENEANTAALAAYRKAVYDYEHACREAHARACAELPESAMLDQALAAEEKSLSALEQCAARMGRHAPKS
jgi:hypothetical protein